MGITWDDIENGGPELESNKPVNGFKSMKEKYASMAQGQNAFSDFGRTLNKDFMIARGAATKAKDSLEHGKRVAAEVDAGVIGAEKAVKNDMKLEQIGSKFLEDFGRGSKGVGAGKVAAYMIGASMLVDMLNPFND